VEKNRALGYAFDEALTSLGRGLDGRRRAAGIKSWTKDTWTVESDIVANSPERAQTRVRPAGRCH